MLSEEILIRLCRAREMLRNTDDSRPSIRGVACETGMSPYHFIRLFKAVFGITPYQCQLDARLEKAKYLLAMGDLPVTEICMEAGFSSLGSFSYLFSRRIGVPPSAYRRRLRPLALSRGGMPHQLIPGCMSLMCGSD